MTITKKQIPSLTPNQIKTILKNGVSYFQNILDDLSKPFLDKLQETRQGSYNNLQALAKAFSNIIKMPIRYSDGTFHIGEDIASVRLEFNKPKDNNSSPRVIFELGESPLETMSPEFFALAHLLTSWAQGSSSIYTGIDWTNAASLRAAILKQQVAIGNVMDECHGKNDLMFGAKLEAETALQQFTEVCEWLEKKVDPDKKMMDMKFEDIFENIHEVSSEGVAKTARKKVAKALAL